jgi:hypothetical protein
MSAPHPTRPDPRVARCRLEGASSDRHPVIEPIERTAADHLPVRSTFSSGPLPSSYENAWSSEVLPVNERAESQAPISCNDSLDGRSRTIPSAVLASQVKSALTRIRGPIAYDDIVRGTEAPVQPRRAHVEDLSRALIANGRSPLIRTADLRARNRETLRERSVIAGVGLELHTERTEVEALPISWIGPKDFLCVDNDRSPARCPEEPDYPSDECREPPLRASAQLPNPYKGACADLTAKLSGELLLASRAMLNE